MPKLLHLLSASSLLIMFESENDKFKVIRYNRNRSLISRAL